jgi:hypothetical protein
MTYVAFDALQRAQIEEQHTDINIDCKMINYAANGAPTLARTAYTNLICEFHQMCQRSHLLSSQVIWLRLQYKHAWLTERKKVSSMSGKLEGMLLFAFSSLAGAAIFPPPSAWMFTIQFVGLTSRRIER